MSLEDNKSLQSVKRPSPRSETDFILLYQTKLINIINAYNLWEQVRQPVLRIVFSKDNYSDNLNALANYTYERNEQKINSITTNKGGVG